MSVEFCVRVGGGINIGIPNEPKFAVIEISWPGNRRHSVEQSLRHRRIELFLRLSLDVKLSMWFEIFFWIKKRIFEYSLPRTRVASCLSRPWIRNSSFWRIVDPQRKGFQSMENDLNPSPSQLHPTSFVARIVVVHRGRGQRIEINACTSKGETSAVSTLLTRQFLTYRDV